MAYGLCICFYHQYTIADLNCIIIVLSFQFADACGLIESRKVSIIPIYCSVRTKQLGAAGSTLGRVADTLLGDQQYAPCHCRQ